MSTRSMFLRGDVAFEPTVDGWYAWSQLLAPQTAALHLARSQLKILDSFVRSPAVHAAAVENPAMRGGPFLDVAPSRAGEVKAFAERLRRERAGKLELAAAIEELEKLLAAHPAGASLEPLYTKVPAALRGMVELVYDASNRAGFRFVERLMHRSRFREPDAQALFARRLEGDAREFVLSTPRVSSEGLLELRVPFDQPAIDALFAARWSASDPSELAERLCVPPASRGAFGELFSERAPRSDAAQRRDGVRVRYFGHACVLVESARTSILLDPLIPYRCASDPPRFTFEDLPERIDFVLITHGHQDHLVLESLLPLRSRVGAFVVPRSSGGALEDPSLKLALEHAGFANVIELDELERLAAHDGEIVALPFLGEHGDLRIRAKCGYLVRLDGRSLAFVADSCNLDGALYDAIREVAGPIDELFLGMECEGAPMSWLYGALLSAPLARGMDQSRRLAGSNFERAADLVDRLAPRSVRVYAMGQEPWCSFITSTSYTDESLPIVESNRLIAHGKARGIDAQRLYGASEWSVAP